MENQFVNYLDLGIAYRKAKADLFYSSRPSRLDLLYFEKDLINNLNKLKGKINNGPFPKAKKDLWSVIPKGFKLPNIKSDVISSDTNYKWQAFKEEAGENRIEAQFRLMEKLPIEIHVLSSIWINKIGSKFESKLTDSARGNRLRRTEQRHINHLSLGSTVPYLYPYCKWRDDGISIMESSLKENKSIVAITADIQSFYHKLDVRFMVNSEFIKRINLDLTKEELNFHQDFIDYLHNWALSTPLKRGLPVGLSASSVIANLALFEFDLFIENAIAPLYYGRYVDDIILVMDNGFRFANSNQVWDWLINHSNSNLHRSGSDGSLILYVQPYLAGSKISFNTDKTKTFLLKGIKGKAILESIRDEIVEMSSEWRSLPSLPDSSVELESMLLSAVQSNGDAVDNLRKADSISIKRANFALKLRDIEAICRVQNPEVSTIQRQTFLRAFKEHITILPVFFNFFNYLPRVLRLAIAFRDFDLLKDILISLEELVRELQSCQVKLNSVDSDYSEKDVLDKYLDHLGLIINESIASSMPTKLSAKETKIWNKHFSKSNNLKFISNLNEIQLIHEKLCVSDLGYFPLKYYLLPNSIKGYPKMTCNIELFNNIKSNRIQNYFSEDILTGVKIIQKIGANESNELSPLGTLVPTRPLGIHDLYVLHSEAFTKKGAEEIGACLLSQRGYKPTDALPTKFSNEDDTPIDINFIREDKSKLRIAVTSWKTNEESWVAALCSKYDPDTNRLNRLNNLINNLIKSKVNPDYLIFPELSIPPHWFLYLAGKLRRSKVSLICGVEYIHTSSGEVFNQVWSALTHDSFGFNEMIIVRQDKQKPGYHEENEMWKIKSKSLSRQLVPWGNPPIINHGGFLFSILICSELTNISYRDALRGKIDALFVPEWNQDIDTFNALVESSALDIHAFLIQCNNRQFGDSRIRGPYKENWLRDIVRVKGGIDDYYVVGEINIKELRAFQSSDRSPNGPFKPIPDGFVLSKSRKILPYL